MLILERQLPLCIIQNSFAVHPAYNSNPNHLAMEADAHARVAALLHNHLVAMALDPHPPLPPALPPVYTPASAGPSCTAIWGEHVSVFRAPAEVEWHPSEVLKEANVAEAASLAASVQSRIRATAFIHVVLLPRWMSILQKFLRRMQTSGLLDVPDVAVAINLVWQSNNSDSGWTSTRVVDGDDKEAVDEEEMRFVKGMGEDERQQFVAARLSFLSEDQLARVSLFSSPWYMEAFETSTLTLLQEHAQATVREDAGRAEHLVLYMHSKGVGKAINEAVEDWVAYMLHFVLDRFPRCWEELITRPDGSGLTGPWKASTCGVDLSLEPQPHYSGNFWWARADYLADWLPAPVDFVELDSFPNKFNSWYHNNEFWVLGPNTCYYSSADAAPPSGTTAELLKRDTYHEEDDEKGDDNNGSESGKVFSSPFGKLDRSGPPLRERLQRQEPRTLEQPHMHVSLWQSGINVYRRNEVRYPGEAYEQRKSK